MSSDAVQTDATVGRPATDTTDRRAVDDDHLRRRRVLVGLAIAAVLVTVAFLVVDVQGSWAFALELRATKVAAMALVAVAVAVSTVVFQTLTTNRILTPSIMGFDALYLLIQSAAVFAFGAVTFVSAPPPVRFGVEVALMIGFAWVLFRRLFRVGDQNLYLLVLSGIVLGTLFGSLTSLVNRLIDPNEFQTLQDLLFASFTTVDEQLLLVSAVAVAGASGYAWYHRRVLDVVALGHDQALNLGVDHHPIVRRQLAAVAVLVSVSTALVGPVTFFGLLVANLARQLLGTFRHRWTMPGAALLGVGALVGGQLVLEHVLGLGTALAVIVNFVGGVYFLALLLREARQ